MISFYPGPSKINKGVAQYMQQAHKQGLLSINHRSKEFVAISKKTISLLKKKLNIPSSYQIFFTSSATECWEIIAQSLIKNKSYHIYNGAFGEKWFEYTRKIIPLAAHHSFNFEQELKVADLKISKDTETICLVHNETSNGTQINERILKELKTTYKDSLLAIDATSSMAGIKLDFKNADIWFASVQKCFGLPAGMALLICSPDAIKKAALLQKNKHYNSLIAMAERMRDWQTTYTPNVLGIYLLQEVMNHSKSIRETDQLITKRYHNWYVFLNGFKEIKPLIVNADCRSKTVIAIQADEGKIKSIKAKAKKEGILLGNGYGNWSKNTFRIANFPAIEEKEIKTLQNFLKKNIK